MRISARYNKKAKRVEYRFNGIYIGFSRDYGLGDELYKSTVLLLFLEEEYKPHIEQFEPAY